MNTALEYCTRVVQEGGRRCKKSTLNDLVHLTPLRIPLMNPPSDPFPLPPSQCTVLQTVCDCGEGVMLKCTLDHILQEFYTPFLTRRFRTYKIATPSQTKVTSKDDIKGFVSLKFLRLKVHSMR
jgi:hypothetical protein